MKLSPKPNHPFKKQGWDDLNQLLLNTFDSPKINEPVVLASADDYEMSIEEIVEEATKQGYKVSVNGNRLTFK